MKKICLALALVATALHAQDVARPAYSSARLEKLIVAIGRAEGFGLKGTLATRYHNPGNFRGLANGKFPGQVRIGKKSYVVFMNDTAGKAALRNQFAAILEGRSRRYTLDMTINQVARTYAESWRTWTRYVSKELGVAGTTTLRQYLCSGDVDVPPALQFPAVPLAKGAL